MRTYADILAEYRDTLDTWALKRLRAEATEALRVEENRPWRVGTVICAPNRRYLVHHDPARRHGIYRYACTETIFQYKVLGYSFWCWSFGLHKDFTRHEACFLAVEGEEGNRFFISVLDVL